MQVDSVLSGCPVVDAIGSTGALHLKKAKAGDALGKSMKYLFNRNYGI
jgi:hypothetical protein